MLYLATLGGARVWHLEHQVGSLTVGKRADVILIDSSRPHLDPLNDPVTSVVLNAGPSDVDTVIVDGEVVKSGRVGAYPDRTRELVVASSQRLVSPGAAAARATTHAGSARTVHEANESRISTCPSCTTPIC